MVKHLQNYLRAICGDPRAIRRVKKGRLIEWLPKKKKKSVSRYFSLKIAHCTLKGPSFIKINSFRYFSTFVVKLTSVKISTVRCNLSLKERKPYF